MINNFVFEEAFETTIVNGVHAVRGEVNRTVWYKQGGIENESINP